MAALISLGFAPIYISTKRKECHSRRRRVTRSFKNSGDGFPSFLPKEVEQIKDPFARNLAKRIERLPVQISYSDSSISSSCIKPLIQHDTAPVVLLHGFDSSCLEWRYTYPLLEEAGLEAWAVDILGWGFSDLEKVPPCNVASKREHLYQLWKSYIKKPMILVGPSLGAAVAIDLAVNHPDAIEKLVLIDASVYTEGTGSSSSLPKTIAYAGVSILKSIPLRWYANFLAFKSISLSTSFDWVKTKQETLIIWGKDDQIISNKLAERLQHEMPNAIVHQISECGHLPHVEKPDSVAKLIVDFAQGVNSRSS